MVRASDGKKPGRFALNSSSESLVSAAYNVALDQALFKAIFNQSDIGDLMNKGIGEMIWWKLNICAT